MARIVGGPGSGAGGAVRRPGWAHTVGAFAGVVLAAFVSGYLAASLVLGRVFSLGDAWPFTQRRIPIQPLVSFWWPVVLGVVVVSGCVLARWLRLPLALVVLCTAICALALTLAVRAIPSFPATATGAADCRAVLFGSGPYGDSDDVCFDVRVARTFDSLSAGFTGIFIGGAGVALLLRRQESAAGVDNEP